MQKVVGFLNRLNIVNIIALVIIITCSIIVLTSKDKELIQKYFDMSLVGVIGWAFTQNARIRNNSEKKDSDTPIE